MLDLEHVVPAVTEVVLVPDGVALGADQLVEADVVLQHALLSLVDIEGGDEVRRSVVAAGAEAVQVAVGPAHRGLDRVVHPGQRQVAGQVEAPPDRCLHAVQVQPDTEPGHLRRARAQLGLRGGVEILEDARDVPAEQRLEECLLLLGCAAGDQLLDEALGVGWRPYGAQSIILGRSPWQTSHDRMCQRVGDPPSADSAGRAFAGTGIQIAYSALENLEASP